MCRSVMSKKELVEDGCLGSSSLCSPWFLESLLIVGGVVFDGWIEPGEQNSESG